MDCEMIKRLVNWISGKGEKDTLKDFSNALKWLLLFILLQGIYPRRALRSPFFLFLRLCLPLPKLLPVWSVGLDHPLRSVVKIFIFSSLFPILFCMLILCPRLIFLVRIGWWNSPLEKKSFNVALSLNVALTPVITYPSEVEFTDIW